MSQTIVLQLPDELLQRARAFAAQTHRPLEDLLVDWLDRASAEPPVETLPDDQVLALCESQLPAAQQAELSDLLAQNREGALDAKGLERLDVVMSLYRRGQVRKAQAFKVAVERGLLPSLN
jgi:hypothetical protein